MRKLISFTLYGQDPKYVEGMFRNLELKEQFYPDWEVIVFHDNSVANDVIERLGSAATLRNVSGYGIFPASWRFLAYDEDNMERFISRDADSRLSQREADAVTDWEDSEKILHVMRDHPHHGSPAHGKPILGGMWGMTRHPLKQFGADVNTMRDLCLRHQGGKKHTTNRDEWFWTDMNFLRDAIYRVLGNTENCKAHAARDYMHKVTWENEPWAIDFPTPRNEDKNFVGEVIEIIDGKEQRAYQYTEL
jgi:hypothetical protein|tara:strand:+ start:475 stop:1218 length:744 start_codon:yes stop_codon:yes gene_type:complete